MSDDDVEEDDGLLSETTDLSDAKLASRKRNRDEREKVEEDKLWRAVLGERIGRRALYKWLVAAGAFKDDFVVSPNGAPDQYFSWYRAGQKELGQRLLFSWMKIDFELVNQMMLENDYRFAPVKRKRGPDIV